MTHCTTSLERKDNRGYRKGKERKCSACGEENFVCDYTAFARDFDSFEGTINTRGVDVNWFF